MIIKSTITEILTQVMDVWILAYYVNIANLENIRINVIR